MPKLSPTMETGILSNWLVKPGDIVKKSHIIGEIETDKAIMEIEALEPGKIGYLLDVVNKEVAVNSIIGFIVEKNEEEPANWNEYLKNIPNIALRENANKKEEVLKESIEVTVNNVQSLEQVENNYNIKEDNQRIIISPLAKVIAQQNDVDITKVQGTGPNNRIVKADIEQYLTGFKTDFLKQEISNEKVEVINTANILSNETIEIPLTNIRKIIAAKLTKSKQEIPHAYLEKEICMDELAKLKNNLFNKFNQKISFTPFFIKAVALALQDNLIMNCIFENGKLIQYKNSNISLAIAVENGLVTPVIKNAEEKSVKIISQELENLANLAKEGKLKLEHMQNGSFSLSNLGMFGINSFQAIINSPQIAILGISKVDIKAVFEDEKFVPKKIMKINLSFDHRIVDGAQAAIFMNSIANYIESPEGMFL